MTYTINQLPSKTDLDVSDEIEIQEAGGGVSKKTTIGAVLSADTGARANVALFGDSFAANERSTSYGVSQLDSSLWHIALARVGYHRINPLYHGVGGDTAAMMRARISDVITSGADVVLGNCGVNDFFGYDLTVDAVLADVQYVITSLTSLGMRVIWANCPTQRTTRSGWTLAKQKKCLEYNRRLHRWAETLPGCVIVDLCGAIADIDDANSQPYSSAVGTDGIHPSRHGAVLFAKSASKVLHAALPTRDIRPTDKFDGYGESGSINALNPGVGQMTGTTGVAGAGVTADASGIPSGWKVERSFGTLTSAVVGKMFEPAGTWLEIVINGNTSGAEEKYRASAVLNHSANFVAGNNYRMVVEADVQSDAGLAITELNFRMYFYDGTSISATEWGRSVSGNPDCDAMALGEKMLIETPLYPAPSTLSDARPYLYIGVRGSGTAIIRFRNVACEIVA